MSLLLDFEFRYCTQIVAQHLNLCTVSTSRTFLSMLSVTVFIAVGKGLVNTNARRSLYSSSQLSDSVQQTDGVIV